MKKPLAKYDLSANTVDYQHLYEMVWAAILDKRYKIEVVRIEAYKGVFTIYDGEANDAVIHDVETPLAYGATFGPDIGDIMRWQDVAVEVIATT